VSISLPIVDVTPVETGKTQIRLDYDPPAVPPSSDPEDEDEKFAIYDTLNLEKQYIQRGSMDMPTVDGLAYSRLLPITEDILTADFDKDKVAESILRGQPEPVYTDQLEQQDGDFDSIEIPSLTALTAGLVEGEDYVIESPIFLRNGHADSAMTTTSVELEPEAYEGYNIPNVPSPLRLQTKTYDITPHIREESNTGALTAVQYFDAFEVNFVSPIKIHSDSSESGTVKFWCEQISTDDFGCKIYEGYGDTNLYGVHAEEGPIVIDYVVANKGILIQNGTLNITIYSNTILDQQQWACTYGTGDQAREYLNISYPPVQTEEEGVITETQPLSEIDTWRKTVQNNPFSQAIASVSDSSSGGSGQSSSIQEMFNDSAIGQYYSRLEERLGGDEEQEAYEFYSDALSWTYATQYESYQLTIPIVNGRAQLSIPANDTVATLFVEASYLIDGTRFESIRSDLVMVRNPLSIGGLDPYRTTPSGDPDDRYELGGAVTWKDGKDGVITDNTTVNYSLSTPANPSVSATLDGWAGGVMMGPKDRVMVP
ncbi:MAG: hypothetical protein QF535_21155, partial [Anaerolineales bacterium]|nr:hypothetical protein [Anaerolineales bacterium]